MTGYSRGDLPPWPYGPQPPTVRPLRYYSPHPEPLLREGVAITCGGPTLGPRLGIGGLPNGWYQVSVDVDGYELPPMPWGRIEIPVHPGMHTFRVFRREQDRILSFTETTEPVLPGELLELAYNFYPNDSNDFDWGAGGRKAFLWAIDPNVKGSPLIAFLLLGGVALTFLLIIGAGLLLR